MGDGSDGGIGDPTGDPGAGPDGLGPAGPGPAESAEAGDSAYGGDAGFGGLGALGSGGTSALGMLGNVTDLSDVGFDSLGLNSLADLSNTDALGTVPSFNVAQDTTQTRNLLSKLGKVAQAFGLVTGNPVASAMGTQANTASSSNPMGSMAQAGLGFAFGPIGVAAGMGLNAMGAFDGLAGVGNVSTPQGNEGMGFNDWASSLGNLGGIYAGYKGQQQMGDMLGGLQSLYSQNSPYSQMLQQQLARRDAASGRRSQYGPRNVELQAKLAQMASSQIPAMSQLAQNQSIARNAMLQQGIGLLNKTGALKSGWQTLQDLMGNGGWSKMIGQQLPNGANMNIPTLENFYSGSMGNDPWQFGLPSGGSDFGGGFDLGLNTPFPSFDGPLGI